MNKLIIILVISLQLLQAAPALSQETAPAQEKKDYWNETPKDTLRNFIKFMFSGTVKGDNAKNLARALEYIEPSTDEKYPELKSQTLKKAKDLFFLIESINYSTDEIVLMQNSEDSATIELGNNQETLELTLVNTPKHGWIFANTNFTNPKFHSALSHIENIRENIAQHADEFDIELSSPLNSLYTFLFGVQNINGYTIKNAVNVLDLATIDQKIIDELGPTWAIKLYRMLQFASPIKPESLSNNPFYDGNVILLLDADFGMISMAICNDTNTDKKAWKIKYSGTTGINRVYDSFMRQGMAADISLMNIVNSPLHVIIDDFFQINFPMLENEVFGINLWKFILVALLLISSLGIMPLTRAILMPIVNIILTKLHITTNNDTSKRFIFPLQISIMAYVWMKGIVVITANPKFMSMTVIAMNIVICLTVALLVCRFIDSTCSVASYRFDSNLHILTSVIGKLLKVIVIIAAGLYICHIFNIDTKSFLAAMGIGGFAFALAGKDTIENFFGSIMIIVDRPFHNGDMVKIANTTGTIEQVGVRSTRIRTLENTVVTIPNRMFISSEVENIGIRKYRRYNTTFDILYETDTSMIDLFVQGISELVRLHPQTSKDNIQAYFYNLGASSLQIYVNMLFINTGRDDELKARQEINTQIMRLAQKLGIEFAYPTQTLYINQNEPKESLTETEIETETETGTSSSSSTRTGISPGILLARKISPYYDPEAKE